MLALRAVFGEGGQQTNLHQCDEKATSAISRATSLIGRGACPKANPELDTYTSQLTVGKCTPWPWGIQDAKVRFIRSPHHGRMRASMAPIVLRIISTKAKTAQSYGNLCTFHRVTSLAKCHLELR